MQVAEIEVDATQLEQYKAAVHEQIETAIRVEPGVLVLYAVADKDSPTHVKVFEIYADKDAYQSAPAIRAFQEVQDHDRENGQVAETRPNRSGGREVMTPHRAYWLLLLLAAAGLPSSQACTDEARGLITIGVQRAFEDVKPAYEAASGRKLNVEFASTQDIVGRVQEGQPADFLITSRAGADLLIKEGKLAAENNFVVVQSSIALAVPAGHPRPDISTVDKLKSALLAAARITYTDPASGGPSGIRLAKVWRWHRHAAQSEDPVGSLGKKKKKKKKKKKLKVSRH